jgi:histidinol-phosphate aminotransferase
MRKALDDVWLYPDDSAHYFRQKVASKFSVKFENTFAAAGSVEVLELCGIAFLSPGDNVVTSEKTFAVYHLLAAKAGVECRQARMEEPGYRYDLNAILKRIDKNTKIVFLANPTNPTGTWFTKTEFDDFMTKIPEDVLVVYDSAYQEYCTCNDMPDPMPYFKQGRRIMILRTLSKAYGLAGLRIGFAIAPTDIINGLMAVRFSFNTNILAHAAAIAALDDEDFVRRTREHNAREMEFLKQGLSSLPVVAPPSQTNFLLIDTKKDAQWLFIELQKRGVIVRPMGGNGLPQAIRISTGLREDNEAFLKYFKELIESPEGYFQHTST